MIGKGKSISHVAAAIDYAMNKDKAEVLDMKGVFATNGKEIETQFDAVGSYTENLKNKGMSFVLSPTPEEGASLSNENYRQLVNDFTMKMGLKNNQWVAVKHKDRDHTHIHLFVNRKDMNGKVYKDSFVGKRSQLAADHVAKTHGLVRAKEVQLNKKEMHKELRNEIYATHKEVMKSNPLTLSDYSERMKAQGVIINPSINKSGKLQGFRVVKNGVDLKASAVHRSMSLSKMLNNKLDLTKGILNPTFKISNAILSITKDISKNISKDIDKDIGYEL